MPASDIRDWMDHGVACCGMQRLVGGSRTRVSVRDLREWMARVDEIGELTRIDGASPEYELGGLVDLYQWDMGNPALLFDHIQGYKPGYRILANVLTSMRRLALC